MTSLKKDRSPANSQSLFPFAAYTGQSFAFGTEAPTSPTTSPAPTSTENVGASFLKGYVPFVATGRVVKANDWKGIRPALDAEAELWNTGDTIVAGVDEAGRGAWAGPLVAAAVVLRPGPTEALLATLAGVNDSKALTAAARDRLFAVVRTQALGVGVGIVSALTIDLIGVGEANKLAWLRAIRALPARPDHLLLDAFPLPHAGINYTAYIKGDARSLSIAAASIIAKVTRDRLLEELEHTKPGYGFGAHKGYGTAVHAAALSRLGPCPEHRYSYAPVWAAYEKDYFSARIL